MKRMMTICLLSTLLTSQACSAEIANTQGVPTIGQEMNQNEQLRGGNENTSDSNTGSDLQTVNVDKTSIKNTKGLIVLSDRYGKNDFIRFYNDDGSLWYEFTYYYAVGGGKFEANDDFLPFAFHPDYFSLALKCTGEDSNRYQVIVNEETGLKKFVKKDDAALRFQSWEDHIKGAFAVKFDHVENPLRESPEGKVKNADLPEDATFHPVQVNGDWLKVRWDSSKKSGSAQVGWIKWKENEKLLIELYYFA